MMEILAPAGSMEALRAAVQNGANAVYLGVGAFNARQGAKNFTTQTLKEAVAYAHVRGVAIHLTLNTLVSDRESRDAAELIRQATLAGVDAFIVQDLGILSMCRELAPEVALHASTQMSIHSLEGVRKAAALGFSRVVLSRELSREEIAAICRESPVEIEVFAHGALCMCYSGQCYMSGVIGRRSGNRGQCAQPCRLPYGYGRFENKNPLSLKDNCLIDSLRELEEMGVASVKLEGRMKRPEYVAMVTRIYRTAMDTGRVTEENRVQLAAAFNRQGFTRGYYEGRTGRDMFGIRESEQEDKTLFAAARASYEGKENPLVSVELTMEVTKEGSCLTASDDRGNRCVAHGPRPEAARSRELTEEELVQRLSKTGGTFYRCKKITAATQPGLSLPASAINALRREALEKLTALRESPRKAVLGELSPLTMEKGYMEAPSLRVQLAATEQLTEKLLAAEPELLYVPLHLLEKDRAVYERAIKKVPLCAVLPRILWGREEKEAQRRLDVARSMGITCALVGNLGQVELVKRTGLTPLGDFGLNVYNSRSINVLKAMGLGGVTLSFEMTLPQIRDISKLLPTEAIVYGRLPLMVVENCLFRGRTGKCSCQDMPRPVLVDRMGEEFPIMKDGASCRSILLNGKTLYWLDKRAQWEALGLSSLRLMLTTERAGEVDALIRAWETAESFREDSQTRGLYLRGVE